MIVQALSQLQLIDNPHVSHEQLFMICFELIKQGAEVKTDFEGELQRFIELVLFEGRLSIVPHIATLYHKLIIEHNRVIEAEVISAFMLDENEKQAVIRALERRFTSKVTAHYVEDPSLIGGLLIKSDDWVFDGTIRSKLKRLAQRII